MADGTEDLPDGWTVVSVGEAGSIRLGRQRSPEKLTGEFPVKYLRAANVTMEGLDLDDVQEMDFTPEEQQVYGLQAGDLVLAEASGSASHVGRAAIWRDEIPGCCFQNTLIRFRPHLLSPEYALVVFRYFSLSGKFTQVSKGVGIQHLGASRLAAIPVMLPPLPEQQRIARAVEERIQEIRQASGSLRSARQLIGEQNREILWAAASGALIPLDAGEHAATNESMAGVGAIENPEDLEIQPAIPGIDDEDRMNLGAAHEGLFPIPRSWRWVTAGEAGEIAMGRQRSPKDHEGQHMRPYLRVANVMEDRIDTTSVMEMNFTPEEFDIYSLRSGDILLNEGQSPELVGRAAMYRNEVKGACFQNTLIRFRVTEEVDAEFALLVFRHYLHSGEFKKIARWTTNIAHLGLNRFAAMPFPLPPLDVQKEIVQEAKRRLSESSQQLEATEASLQKLPILETQLYAAAVNGKLVPQDPSDEPTIKALKRLGPTPVEPAVKRRKNLDQENSQLPSSVRPRQKKFLADVLGGSGGATTMPELFRRAKFHPDSVQDVEKFYLALRDELDVSVRVAGESQENSFMEVIQDEAI
ncbi:restriction endonuclease subunit S [Streptosporangium sp. NPDC023963]|uniref:restriction endonuclease subunit S n=1 Tax=Streptosporangium sp. NPDC023963 TaxID=3155608 RepID=UPI00344698A8